MKIYSDGEYAAGQLCFKCDTDKLVFYDKMSDFFTCQKCLYELYEALGKDVDHVRESNREEITGTS